MPIVDDESHLHDDELTSKFQNHFSMSGNGRIIDSGGNYWYIVQENELLNFVSLLENNVGIPIGRILHNSAADAFELILSPLTSVNFGFFGKKKRGKLLNEYWDLFGWGAFNTKENTIISNVFPSIIAGFYLSLIEFEQGQRNRIQWKQLRDNIVKCELEKIDRQISPPQEILPMPWANKKMNQDTGLDVLLERQDVGWSINGRISYVLPCDMMNRIIFNLGGHVGQVPSKVSDAWLLTGFDERIHESFSQFVQSQKELFLRGDDFVYLNDQNDWESVILTHLIPYGLGSVKFLKSQDDIDYFSVNLEPNAPMVIGKLSGIWERANGKESSCQIHLTDTEMNLKIRSRLDFI